MFKKVLGIGLAASLLVGAPAFADVNLSSNHQGAQIIDVFEDAEMVTVIGTLELQPIYYLVAPGPNDPLYLLKIVTSSGNEYYLCAPLEDYVMYEGETVSVTGPMRNSRIFNFSFQLF